MKFLINHGFDIDATIQMVNIKCVHVPHTLLQIAKINSNAETINFLIEAVVQDYPNGLLCIDGVYIMGDEQC